MFANSISRPSALSLHDLTASQDKTTRIRNETSAKQVLEYSNVPELRPTEFSICPENGRPLTWKNFGMKILPFASSLYRSKTSSCTKFKFEFSRILSIRNQGSCRVPPGSVSATATAPSTSCAGSSSHSGSCSRARGCKQYTFRSYTFYTLLRDTFPTLRRTQLSENVINTPARRPPTAAPTAGRRRRRCRRRPCTLFTHFREKNTPDATLVKVCARSVLGAPEVTG